MGDNKVHSITGSKKIVRDKRSSLFRSVASDEEKKVLWRKLLVDRRKNMTYPFMGQIL
jgi:hypothetical protein